MKIKTKNNNIRLILYFIFESQKLIVSMKIVKKRWNNPWAEWSNLIRSLLVLNSAGFAIGNPVRNIYYEYCLHQNICILNFSCLIKCPNYKSAIKSEVNREIIIRACSDNVTSQYFKILKWKQFNSSIISPYIFYSSVHRKREKWYI